MQFYHITTHELAQQICREGPTHDTPKKDALFLGRLLAQEVRKLKQPVEALAVIQITTNQEALLLEPHEQAKLLTWEETWELAKQDAALWTKEVLQANPLDNLCPKDQAIMLAERVETERKWLTETTPATINQLRSDPVAALAFLPQLLTNIQELPYLKLTLASLIWQFLEPDMAKPLSQLAGQIRTREDVQLLNQGQGAGSAIAQLHRPLNYLLAQATTEKARLHAEAISGKAK